MKVAFLGPSYTLRSKNIDAQRSVNLYPTLDETGEGKNAASMVGTPGLLTLASATNTAARGAWSTGARAFQVNGNTLYEIASDGTKTSRGTLLTNTGFVSLSDNGIQLVLVDGPYGYIFTLGTNAFGQITDPDFYGANTVCYIDGYFVFNRPVTGKYYISAILDGTAYDQLDFASAEGSPDNLVGVAAVRRNLFLLGERSVEVAYNSGNPDFPFDRVQGAFMEYGCAAAGAIIIIANTIFWIGNDKDGNGTVWMAEDYAPKRISTFAIEYYLSTLTLAQMAAGTGYGYQEEGHYFVAFNFPGADTTFVYDITLKSWHERQYLNPSSGLLERHRAQTHMFCFGKHLVGDYVDGTCYDQNLDYLDDDGDITKRIRRTQYISNDLEYLFFGRLQLDLESGVGITGATPVEDNDPQIILRWSDDGGNTWSNELNRSMGKLGQYMKRIIWNRLGKSRNRIYEMATVARVKVNIIAGHLIITKGTPTYGAAN